MKYCKIQDLKPGMFFTIPLERINPEDAEIFYIKEIKYKSPNKIFFRLEVEQYINNNYIKTFIKDFACLTTIIVGDNIIVK